MGAVEGGIAPRRRATIRGVTLYALYCITSALLYGAVPTVFVVSRSSTRTVYRVTYVHSHACILLLTLPHIRTCTSLSLLPLSNRGDSDSMRQTESGTTTHEWGIFFLDKNHVFFFFFAMSPFFARIRHTLPMKLPELSNRICLDIWPTGSHFAYILT